MRYRLSRALRLRAALLVIVAVGWSFVPAAAAREVGGHHVGVLTRNLYLGSGLTNIVAATTFDDFVGAVSQDWANVVANDFSRRAEALATEIQLTRPDVVGLQEVSLFRDQFVSDIVLGNTTPNATNVVYDYLSILQDELAARGVPYTAVSTSTNADVEAPRVNPESPDGFTDVRLTDRDVILVRSSITAEFANARDGHYAAQLTTASLGGPVTFTRGWASIDYAIAPDTTVRIFDTHLETTDGPLVQVDQGAEALAIIDSSPYPVIALGDFNSAADGSTTPTYANLTATGGLKDAWAAFRPFSSGKTCCQDELLDTISPPTERIDLVLTKGPWTTDLAVRTGVFPFRLFPPPLWASDHFGVFASLQLDRA
jgi:endonuclease/exonuclease/phosphatase family metal-dependent hydrolase